MTSQSKPALSSIPIGPRHIYAIFNVSRDALKNRGLQPENGKYDLAEVWTACKSLINEKYNRALAAELEEDERSYDDLRRLKILEETRRLKIENDLKEGFLVPSDEVAETYSVGIKAMCDVLDGIPSRLKMKFPDISQAVLDAVNLELAESRNKAVERLHEIEV